MFHTAKDVIGTALIHNQDQCVQKAKPNTIKISEQKTKLHKVQPTLCRADSWDKMPKKAALVRMLSSVCLPFTTTLHRLSTQLRFFHQKS